MKITEFKDRVVNETAETICKAIPLTNHYDVTIVRLQVEIAILRTFNYVMGELQK